MTPMKTRWFTHAAAMVALGLSGLVAAPQLHAADQAPAIAPAPGGAPGAAPGGANPGGGRGGRGAPGGFGNLWGGHESETAVPGALHVVENLVDGWRVNPIDAQKPDQVANFRGNPPTVAITSLIEVTDETADKITKLSAGADTRAKELVVKYGAKVDKIYRKRLDSAKNLLSEDDKKFLDALVKGWDACDEATRKVTETDATKRAEELKAARSKALDEYLKTMKPEHSSRLLKVFANHTARIANALAPDAELCVYWGNGRLEWDELFKAADGDAEKFKTFNADYTKAVEAEHEAFRKELQALYDKIRDEIIAALPNETDRTDLAKIAKWSNAHADQLAEIQKQFNDLGQQMRSGFGGGQGGAQVDWQALRQQGQELRDKANELRTDFETQWPDRLKEKVPQAQGWGGGQGGQGAPGGGRGRGRGRGGDNGGGGAPPGGGGGGGANPPADGGAGEF